MPLPDISRFAALDPSEWRRLGMRLAEIGLTSECLSPAVDVGGGLPPNLRLPVQRWHARRMAGPAAAAARLLMFEEPIQEREVHKALGEQLTESLIEAGVIVRQDGALRCPFHLSIADRIFILSDDLTHGGDAAMGASETTVELCRAAYPAGPVGRTIEIGCGAGTIALVLARRSQSVVATDINPRALMIARANAAVNGIGNVEFLEGDAFEPATGEQFDLLVSQPPYVARPLDARQASYLYGGTRGDELPLRLLEAVCTHLTPRGRAVLAVQWPETTGEPAEELVRRTIACDDARALLLRYAPSDLDYQCAMYAAAEVSVGREPFETRFAIWRDHLEAMGIRRLQNTLTILERNPDFASWTASVDVPAEYSDSVTSARIDGLIACQDLATLDDDRLMRATLRPPDEVVFAKEYTLDSPQSPRIVARLPEESLGQTVDLSEGSLLLISLVAESETVSAAVEKFSMRQRIGILQAAEQMLPAIRQALRLGALRPSNCLRTQPSPGNC